MFLSSIFLVTDFLCIATAECVHYNGHGTYCTACHCVGAVVGLFYSLCFSLSLPPAPYLAPLDIYVFFLSRYLQSLHCHRALPSKKQYNANVTCQINGKVGFSALYSVLAEALADWSRAAPAKSSAP